MSKHGHEVGIGVVIYIMSQLSGVNAFAIFDQIGKWNAPTVDPGFRPTVASTKITLVPTRAH